ncbi:MAG: metallophosphoesterase [Nitrospirae bacterium]|nr:metallophosphoesterase [Nitrospirota bacterium]
MIKFILIFITIYGGLNLYFLQRLRAAFAISSFTLIMVILFLIMVICSHFITRLTSGHHDFAIVSAYIGNIWMGLLLMFIAVAFPMDIYRFFVILIGHVTSKDLLYIIPTKRQLFLIPMSLSIIIFIYGWFEARNIILEEVEIKTNRLPANIDKFRIVQITDVHLGLMSHDGRLNRILDKVKEANADILISTGDLLDAEVNNNAEYIDLFREINPKYGKFAVMGNHEFYVGYDQSVDFAEKAGFRVLRSEIVNIDGIINLAGVDDLRARKFSLGSDNSELDFLAKKDNVEFTVFLKHQPVVNDNSKGLINLQISGHTHDGQFFPYSLLTHLFYPIPCGLTQLDDDLYIYLSRGSGTWGPPIRFLAPPEVTVIDLVKG